MKLALLQLGTAGVDGAQANLEAALAAIDAAGARGAELAVLPEATYPAYLLGRNWREREDLLTLSRLAEILGERARRWKMGICAGLADRERGTNSAVLVSPDGSLAGHHDKVFLWHFDSRWFVRGRSFAAWNLPWGRTGMLICADARYPESARLLALQGAALVLDPAGLVAVGKDFSNSQLDYLLPVRAAENGLHLVLTGKVGNEGGFIRYAGGSAVFAPDGTCMTRTEKAEEETLLVDVDLPAGKAPFPVPRRPELYGDLSRTLPSPAFPPPVPRTCLAAALCLPSRTAPTEALAGLASGLIAAQTRLVLFPPVPEDPDLFSLYAASRNLPYLLEVTQKAPWTLVVPLLEEVGGSLHHTAYVLEGGRVLGTQRATHPPAGSPFRSGNRLEPVDTPYGRIGVMLGPEGLVPEVARILALNGAEILCWACGTLPPGVGIPPLAFARARADENRVNLLLSAHGPEKEAAVVAAGGSILALGGPGEIRAALGRLDRWAVRDKELVPGTDLFADRHPEDYRLLTQV